MRKSELNSLLREYVKNHLSPTLAEQSFISCLHDAFKEALGGNSILIGSYARFTAIRPLHDLDILFIAGNFDQFRLDPKEILTTLQATIQKEFKNPTKYKYQISQQTHSITASFSENGKEIFSVDIVPAFMSGLKNEYKDDIYYVPEILKYGPRNRKAKYSELEKTKMTEREWWLKSDPRGYIKAATEMNQINDDFRKAAKLVKRWKHNCKQKFGDFKLKSFHVEQVIYNIFKQNPQIEISDAVFQFFCDLPKFITQPQIPDRADSSKFIDDYLAQMPDAERNKIIRARDAFLIKLENIASGTSVNSLLEADSRKRASDTEEYLFDLKIPVYIEPDSNLIISAYALQGQGSFRPRLLDKIGKLLIGRQIRFRVESDDTNPHYYKWKVKNDDSSPEPRGEITDHSTKYVPENSKYTGNHYVECYAIKDGICVARARQNIVL